jgi:predicted DsbA family dithiol-disulfide isomerase
MLMEAIHKMKVEVWSDIMCPFCYIGKRNYEAGLKQFADNKNIEIVWKSFQLDPNIPQEVAVTENVYQYLAERKGMSYEESVQMHDSVVATAKKVGLEYNFDKTIIANSFNAHRMIQLAKIKGLGDAAEERLFHAYFTEGKNIGNTDVLIDLGKDIGLTEAEVTTALTDDAYAYKVRQDVEEAQQLGVRGVPFFVFDRKYAISGAQPPEAFAETLQKSFSEWRKENPTLPFEVTNGPSCSVDGTCD